MNPEFIKIENAAALPDDWDRCTVAFFQTRRFLQHTERYNPCGQRYFLMYEGGRFAAGFILYTLRLDLLTYLHIKSPVKMHIVGVPCSVSCSGIVGDFGKTVELMDFLQTLGKGFYLALNVEPGVQTGLAVRARTMPTLVLENRYESWPHFLGSLRADYRRRMLRIDGKFRGVEHKSMDCIQFDEEMYRQYLNVWKRSRGKLEKLSCDFFRYLPSCFRLNVYSAGNRLLGWTLSLLDRQTLSFFLGGLDYRRNRLYDTYFNLLSSLLRDGIALHASRIDFGQTAEIPKSRLGCRMMEKMMWAHHSNRLFLRILNAAKPALEYRSRIPEAHVWKANS
ncbi:GNAT family N-acetyltransferase [bacterium]|nr:GNAT family N-acetyltransferase [bacterium]